MREMPGLGCRFHEDEDQEKEPKQQQQQQQQPIYGTWSTMTVSGSWLHHPARYPIGLPQKRPWDRFRMVAPSTAVVGEGCSVGGQASLQKYTNKEAALDFTGGIVMAQGSVISHSGKASNESQQVSASSPKQQQPIYGTWSTMTVSRSWLHHPTRYPIGLPQKRPMDRFRTVAPSTGVVGERCSVGGQASLHKYTNKEAALDFTGGIGMAQGSVISHSGKASNESQQVPASSPATAQEAKTRQKRYRGVRKKPCGEWVAAIRDPSTGAKLSLGTFDTAEKAAAAYKEAAFGFKGSQAKINLPQEVRQRDGNAHHSRRRTLARESQHLGAPHLGAPGHSNPMMDSSSTMSLISQAKLNLPQEVRQRDGNAHHSRRRTLARESQHLGAPHLGAPGYSNPMMDSSSTMSLISQAKLNLPQEVRQRDGNVHHSRRRTLARESQHLGAPGHSNPMMDSSSTMSLISQHFPGFHLYVHLLQTPGLSSLPLIQQCLAMTLSNPSLQEPTSSSVLPRPTETAGAVSASALQDPIITNSPNHTEILSGIGEEFELESLYSNVSGCAAEEYFKRLLLT